MGGYLVYRAVTRMPTLRAAVAMLGSPEWPERADSPHLTPEAFHGTALLSITAERDASVPPGEARGFHERLRAYHPAPERERYVELAGAEHLMGADDWARLMDEATGWLVRWLAPEGHAAPAR
jgi:dienelactone hydrolase